METKRIGNTFDKKILLIFTHKKLNDNIIFYISKFRYVDLIYIYFMYQNLKGS